MGDHSARPRRRGEELIKAIHDAVLEEVLEVGVGRLTMDGIGRRAATPRTTLYRRWSDPVEVLLDALHHQHPVEEPTPGADDLHGDLVHALRLMVEWALSPAGRAVAAILTDPRSAALMSEALFERVFADRGGTFTRTVLRYYADRGCFPAELLTPVVADIGEALVTKRLIDTGAPPTDEELAAIVEQAILPAIGLGPRAPRP
ncbi:TetR-like C-terminal domain-containing protein [Planomonospora sp. ID82291]|uniref:TetR/AcrR family transcriptional regulator n=1 Tax=Planomonospora sp. ID82291 TaxID=2738136 RepID=UPI0018C3C57D|nr:TetR-like C-terminal domain-containing protein [Planomonospora sp. ID82291]MBG0814924.1 TetR/AcrR family transcriptional regulator C-terminal ligand-binding domain-containing protein [Planomonospora sp. ID82291]